MVAVDGLTAGSLVAKQTRFLMSGVPFSGTGFGYNPTPTSGKLDLGYDTGTKDFNTTGTFSATNLSVALLPNLPLSMYANTTVTAIKNAQSNPPGGANSDYTAVDYQHMLLAAQLASTTAPGGIQTIPSFYRPELINYWKNQIGASSWSNLWTASPDLCRKIMLRPIGPAGGITNPDHPNFTGSNPNFDPMWNGATTATPQPQWDVDNDGDGIPDSVWVDLGLPVRSTADGRLYKPLFAILCTDLDGRINVNAHGCADQSTTAYTAAVSAPTGHAFASGVTPVLPRGVGYGPAEINPLAILTNNTTLLSNVLTARYPSAGLGSDLAGKRLSLNKWLLYGGNYWTGVTNDAGAYGSPPDLLGTAAIGLDWGGRALYATASGTVTMGQAYNATTSVASPYELDLSAKRTRGLANTPFGAAELERIFRPYDRDAPSLSARLAQATATTGVATDSVLLQNDSSTPPRPRRFGVTTDSWDLPIPSVAISADALTAGLSVANVTAFMNYVTATAPPLLPAQGVPGVLKLLVMKQLIQNGSTPAAADTQADTIMPVLIAPELLCGRKMDLNRAFGNGRDDNSNNVVDEPQPAETGETVSLFKSTAATGATATPPVSYDPTQGFSSPLIGATTSYQARQLYARYLYILAMLLCDHTYLDSQTGSAANTSRFLAQWAVNVVDFYDRDSIMTPFEYDPQPFNAVANPTGWRPMGT